MNVALKIARGNKTGTEIRLPGKTFLIGRAEECQLRPNSEQISRHHCIITDTGSAVTVKDLGSRNGTQVNGVTIEVETELNQGDLLVCGPLHFEVVYLAELKGEKKPAVKSVAEAAARARSNAQDAATVNAEAWVQEFGRAAADDDTAILSTDGAAAPPKRYEVKRVDREAVAREAAEKARADQANGDTTEAAMKAIRKLTKQ